MKLILAGIAILMSIALPACGVVETGEDVASATEITENAQENMPAEPEAIDQDIAAPDAQSQAEDLTGNWVDVSDASRFVRIEKSGEEYSYEDNEGKLTGTFQDGVLSVKISDSELAALYIDKSTAHLMLVYQDNISEYEKK